MSMFRYILGDGKKVIKLDCIDDHWEFIRWRDENDLMQFYTKFEDGVCVETYFTGIPVFPRSVDFPEPVLFVTEAVGTKYDGYRSFASTYRQSRENHKLMIKTIRDGSRERILDEETADADDEYLDPDEADYMENLESRIWGG